MPVCDVCNAPMNWGEGSGLTTAQVATNEAYWEFVFTHQWSTAYLLDPEGNLLGVYINNQAAQKTKWLVCESCSDLLGVDPEIGRKYNGRWRSPPGTGPADVWEVALAAAFAWSKLYDRWPGSVRRNAAPPASDAKPCDFCHRLIDADEQLALLTDEAVQEFEEFGGLIRPGNSATTVLGETRWLACSLCLQRAARIQRAGAKRRLPPAPRPEQDFVVWSCTSCQRRLKASRERVGKKARCPSCGFVQVLTDDSRTR